MGEIEPVVPETIELEYSEKTKHSTFLKIWTIRVLIRKSESLVPHSNFLSQTYTFWFRPGWKKSNQWYLSILSFKTEIIKNHSTFQKFRTLGIVMQVIKPRNNQWKTLRQVEGFQLRREWKKWYLNFEEKLVAASGKIEANCAVLYSLNVGITNEKFQQKSFRSEIVFSDIREKTKMMEKLIIKNWKKNVQLITSLKLKFFKTILKFQIILVLLEDQKFFLNFCIWFNTNYLPPTGLKTDLFWYKKRSLSKRLLFLSKKKTFLPLKRKNCSVIYKFCKKMANSEKKPTTSDLLTALTTTELFLRSTNCSAVL